MKVKLARIAFLCTGNSCRSQMAEGWARAYAAPGVEVFSAGTHPTKVHPVTIQVMQECDVNISSQTSKGLDALPPEIDYAITVCDHAAQNCPSLGAKYETLHWPVDDPLQVGPEEKIAADFRRIRDELKDRVFTFLRGRNLLRKEDA